MSAYVIYCRVCGPLAMGTGFSSGANAAIAHGNETGHTVISEPATPAPARPGVRPAGECDG